MPTYDLPLDALSAERLDTLVTDATPEGERLEYKEALPKDADKPEFLADVTSFANTSGGDIIFGVRERRDDQNVPTSKPESIVGLPDLNYDAQRLRLDSVVRDGVQPRIAGLQFHEVSRGSAPPCLVVRIPKSLSAPHMITLGGSRRFFARTSGGKYQLDVHQLRAAFVAGETALERLRRFRIERVARVLARITPVEMAQGPIAIFHALPVNPPTDAWIRFRDVGQNERLGWLSPMGNHLNDWRHNLDGFAAYTLNTTDANSYLQLFRDGAIEAASVGLVRPAAADRKYHAVNIEREVIRLLRRINALWSRLGVGAPVMCGLTVAGFKGVRLISHVVYHAKEDASIDRDPLLIPEIILEKLDDPDIALRPLLDVFWNASGWEGSPHYDASGRWKDPSIQR